MITNTVYHYALAIITVVCGIFVLSDIEHTERSRLPKKIIEVVLSIAASVALTVILMVYLRRTDSRLSEDLP